MPYIFCNVGWMTNYQGTNDDPIIGGGGYVGDHNSGHEAFNFRVYEDGNLYGYVQPPGQGNTINITRLGATNNDNSIDGVTVVWTATRPGVGSVIVGWYRNATVYRGAQLLVDSGVNAPPGVPEEFDRFWIKGEPNDATLLPPDNRNFSVPRGLGGMGQANIWYADAPENAEYVAQVMALIDGGAQDIRYSRSEVIPKFAKQPESGENLQMSKPTNVIYYGPPGTGKTWSVVLGAMGIVDVQDYFEINDSKIYMALKKEFDGLVEKGQIEFVTFHQSYGYEDFVIGIKPQTVDGQVTYEVKPGILKRIADKAAEDKDKKPYILIIDEINRGNISKIFGELITLIEVDKRIGDEYAIRVQLPCSEKGKEGERFCLPRNLHIIGTMNTADRSLAQLDIALRRRFDFKPMMPNTEKDGPIGGLSVEKDNVIIDVPEMLEMLNKRIEALYDRDHMIGHAYFIRLKYEDAELRFSELKHIFRNRILPLLEEYFFEDWEKIRLVLGDADSQKKDKELRFINEVGQDEDLNRIFGKDFANADSYSGQQRKRYEINEGAFGKPEAYQLIYRTGGDAQA